MVKIYIKEYYTWLRPKWRPLLENGRPMMAATMEDAIKRIASLRGAIYHLRRGEYAAPDYGVKEPGRRVRLVEP